MKELAYQQDQSAIDVLAARQPSAHRHYEIVLVIVAAIVFFGCIISPPALMDDVDAVHGQMARNMVQSGDWVIAILMAFLTWKKHHCPIGSLPFVIC